MEQGYFFDEYFIKDVRHSIYQTLLTMPQKYTLLFGLCLFLFVSVKSQTALSLSIENCNTFKVDVLDPSQLSTKNLEKSYLLEIEIIKDVWAKIGTIKTKYNTARFENQKTTGRYRASVVDHKFKNPKAVGSSSIQTNIQYSNSVYYNKDLTCDPTLNSVNIDQYKPSDFMVYPNPARSTLIVEIKDLESGAQGEILDIHGRQIMSFNIQNGRNTINVSQLANGVYFLKLLHAVTHPEVKKIFVNASKS